MARRATALVLFPALVVLAATLAGCVDEEAPTSPIVRWSAGEDAGPEKLSRFVTAYGAVRDGSNLDVHVNGVAGATVRIGSLARLTNHDDVPRQIQLRSSALGNADDLSFAIVDRSSTVLAQLRDDGRPPGFLTLQARETWTLSLEISLPERADIHARRVEIAVDVLADDAP